jgi:hypothetical protein
MIKFFRKIRQNLLMENKTGKYFKYAIGEIILVVIGILLALQVNNWNEIRKGNGTKIESIKVIQTNLSQEKDRLDYVIARKQSTIITIEKILAGDFKNIELKKLYGILTRVHLHLVANTGYKIISQNNAINSIENKDLTNALIWFYETHYGLLNSWGDYDRSYSENFMEPYLQSNIPSEPNLFEMEAIIKKELKTIHFRNLLLNKIELDKSYIKIMQTESFVHIEKLQSLIKQEIEK